MTTTRYTWLATTAPADGARVGVQYLGLVRVDEGGTTYWCAGRWVKLYVGCRHDWMEPFRNDFASEAEARAAYDQMAAEWDHAVPYRR
jgi:hypothetical protein